MSDLNQKLYSLNRQQEEEQTLALASRLGLQYVDLVGYSFATEIFSLFPAAQLALPALMATALTLPPDIFIWILSTISGAAVTRFEV